MPHLVSRRLALTAFAGAAAALSLQPAKAAQKLRVGKAVIENPGFLPLDVGMRHGIFAKAGLEIEELNFTGGAKVAQALAAGAVDISLSGGPDMAFTAKGAPQIAIATITSSTAFMGISVGLQSTARNADDLRGKRIGVTSSGSLTYWLVEELNRVKGWTAENDRAIPITVSGSPNAGFAAIKSGAVDASVGSVEVGYQLEEQQAGRLLLRISDYVATLELFVIFASTQLIQQNPDAVRRFLRGWFDTIAFMSSHKAETTQTMSDVIGFSAALASRSYDSLMPKFSTSGRFEPRALETLKASFIDLKLLDEKADMARLYNDSFLP